MRAATIVLGTCLLLPAPFQAQDKPNFSGEWLLNADKSQFGPIPPPECVGLRITHREPEFIVEETGLKGAPCGGFKVAYTTDGKQVTYMAAGVRRRAAAAWVDSSIVIQRVDDDGIRVRIQSSLSPDGKTLTRDLHGESDLGSADWTYVYDRVNSF